MDVLTSVAEGILNISTGRLRSRSLAHGVSPRVEGVVG
jgi:hypothetical protein